MYLTTTICSMPLHTDQAYCLSNALQCLQFYIAAARYRPPLNPTAVLTQPYTQQFLRNPSRAFLLQVSGFMTLPLERKLLLLCEALLLLEGFLTFPLLLIIFALQLLLVCFIRGKLSSSEFLLCIPGLFLSGFCSHAKPLLLVVDYFLQPA